MAQNKNTKKEEGINLVDLFFYLLSYWYWFVLGVLICGGFAAYRYATSTLVYRADATIIIKDPSNKISSAGLDRYDNYINKVNVANEIFQFRSKKLMRDVVSRVSADIDYKVKEGLQMTELYKKSPVSVRFLETTPEMHLNMVVTPLDSSKVMVSDFGSDESDKKSENSSEEGKEADHE